MKSKDWVSIGSSLIACISLFLPGFIYFKKMRIQASAAITASTSLGNYFYIVLAITFLIHIFSIIKGKNKYINYFSGVLAGVLIATVIFFISEALVWLPLEKTEYSRLSIGPSMWLWLISLFSIIIKTSEQVANKLLRSLLYLIPFMLISIMLVIGKLDGLAIVMEYQSKKEEFWRETLNHIKISFSVIILSILLGIPLGYGVHINKKMEKIVFSIINITETIPGLSFIAILMIPLSFFANRFPILMQLGISGIGVAPVFIALFLYAIFPIIHSTRAAFQTIDPQIIEVAEAMGMSKRRIFYIVKLPIALPVVLSGIRLAAVYTLSGVTLAAFTGGGGLGIFMRQTESMDLVLLGAIPVIIITFTLDSFFKKAIDYLSI